MSRPLLGAAPACPRFVMPVRWSQSLPCTEYSEGHGTPWGHRGAGRGVGGNVHTGVKRNQCCSCYWWRIARVTPGGLAFGRGPQGVLLLFRDQQVRKVQVLEHLRLRLVAHARHAVPSGLLPCCHLRLGAYTGVINRNPHRSPADPLACRRSATLDARRCGIAS